jgi:hypothetical protein
MIDLRPDMNKLGGTWIISSEAPTIISLPLIDKPPSTALIAFALKHKRIKESRQKIEDAKFAYEVLKDIIKVI